MLLSALIALAALQQHTALPFSLITKTEAKSPHSETATLVQDKRKAFDSHYLVKDSKAWPRSIQNLNWRHANVIIYYPGLVQKDAKITVKGVKKSGRSILVTVESHHGLSAETYYPMFLIKIPRQNQGLEVQIYDPSKLHGSLRTSRRAFRS